MKNNLFSNNQQVEEYIESLSSPQREIARNIRKIIKETFPAIKENFKWNQPSYDYNGSICYIAAFEDHVDVGFFRGAHMDDPNHILKGTGKQLRHLKVRKLEDINKVVIKEFVKEAVKLNSK